MAEKRDVYQEVTDRICGILETGTVPWHKPWSGGGAGGAGAPHNLRTGRPYRGINTFLLGVQPYPTQEWLTFKQAKDLGGHVRAGEKGTGIVFWRVIDRKKAGGAGEATDASGATAGRDRVFLLRFFTVFNVAQCEGIPSKVAGTTPLTEHERIARAEAIADGYKGGPPVRAGGDRACYSPTLDEIRVPHLGAFNEPAEYYSTLFHEFGHSTGHKSRLGRDMSGHFGDHSYSKEELIAEFSAAFLCAEAGIVDRTVDNSAAYIAGWLRKLRDDKKLAISAAAQAQRAADLVLGRQATKADEEDETSETGAAVAA